jgi:thioredoxin 1
MRRTFATKVQKIKVVAMAVSLTLFFLAPAFGGETGMSKIPVPGMVTMVDLGAKKCIPCKMMAPILQELEEEYKDRAAIVFIDVWENPAAGSRFGIRVIPTQIFYDTEGREVKRHEGFLDKASIVAELQKLGVR